MLMGWQGQRPTAECCDSCPHRDSPKLSCGCLAKFGMSDFLPHYQKIDPTTWAYVSSILILIVFFKFSRVWSVRNFDLILLVLLAPGLILTQKGFTILLNTPPVPTPTSGVASDPSSPTSEASSIKSDAQPGIANSVTQADAENSHTSPEIENGLRLVRNGFLWILGVSLVWLVRLLLDPTMVRRPLLEPNLSLGGMSLACAALFLFIMANVIRGSPENWEIETDGAAGAVNILASRDVNTNVEDYRRNGPGYYFVHVLPRIAMIPFAHGEPHEQSAIVVTAKIMALVLQLAIVAGMIVIGYWHFDNIRTGVGAATLYLMLPYSAQMSGHVDHLLPAALILWAVVFYRHPLYSGMIIGLGMGTSYFALYLLPLWISFYWQRGLLRFLLGTLSSLLVLTALLALNSDGLASFWYKFQSMFGLWAMKMENLRGIWDTNLPGFAPVYRIPVLAVFVVICGGFALWPGQKNLGTLLSCSAAVMIATQFWHPYYGGLYMAWFLPLTLLTVFRPNLEDRIALIVLGEGWFPRSRAARIAQLDRAA